MADDQTITSYLEGRARNLDSLRSTLAREGPKIIPDVLRLTPPSLRTTGAKLWKVLNESERRSAEIGRIEAARQNFHAEMEAGRPVDDLFFRTELLIKEIARASAQQAEKTGEVIERFLLPTRPRHRWEEWPADDPIMWTLAAIHASTEGIPCRAVITGLMRIYSEPVPKLVRDAASASLLTFLDSIPKGLADQAMMDIARLTKGMLWDAVPALHHRVENEYALGEHPMRQGILLTKLATYYLLIPD